MPPARGSAYWSYMSSALRVVSLVIHRVRQRTIMTKLQIPRARTPITTMYIHHCMLITTYRHRCPYPWPQAIHALRPEGRGN